MKIICTKDEKQIISDALLTSDRCFPDWACPELALGSYDCKQCIEKNIKWEVVDANAQAPCNATE